MVRESCFAFTISVAAHQHCFGKTEASASLLSTTQRSVEASLGSEKGSNATNVGAHGTAAVDDLASVGGL